MLLALSKRSPDQLMRQPMALIEMRLPAVPKGAMSALAMAARVSFAPKAGAAEAPLYRDTILRGGAAALAPA